METSNPRRRLWWARLLRSGFDMFVVGLGVAVVGYFVGDWVGKLL